MLIIKYPLKSLTFIHPSTSQIIFFGRGRFDIKEFWEKGSRKIMTFNILYWI